MQPETDMALTEFRQDEADEMDAILNDYDRSLDDILGGAGDATTNQRQQRTSSKPPDALGIDENVNVTKKRKLAPPLDETLLASSNGIPKLQKIARTKLKFRGKGHEFSDVAWLLGTYQVWLHELYPRAKFADGLTMIEKLGHKKRIQKLRAEWINESKPKTGLDEISDHENESPVAQAGAKDTISQRESNLSPNTLPEPISTDDLPTESDVAAEETSGQDQAENQSTGFPDEDELDQLLADEAIFDEMPDRNSFTLPVAQNPKPSHTAYDNFADEEDIMREMGFPD